MSSNSATEESSAGAYTSVKEYQDCTLKEDESPDEWVLRKLDLQQIHDKTIAQSEINGVVDEFKSEINGVVDEFERETGGVADEFQSEINGVVDEFEREIGGVADEFESEINGVVDEFKREIGGAADEFESEINGVVDEFKREIGGAADEFESVINGVVDEFKREIGGAADEFESVINGVVDEFQREIGGAANVHESVINGVVDEFQREIGGAANVHESVINGVVDEFEREIGGAANVHESVINGVVDKFEREIGGAANVYESDEEGGSDDNYSLPELAPRADYSDSSDDESDEEVSLPDLIESAEVVADGEFNLDNHEWQEAISNEMNNAVGHSITYHDDELTVFTDASHAPATNNTHHPMSSNAIEDTSQSDEGSLEDWHSESTAATVRSNTEGSVTSVAVIDDKLTFADFNEARDFALSRWDFLADLQDTPECVIESYFKYWADTLGSLHQESLIFDDHDDPALKQAIWESTHGDQPNPDDVDPFRQKERIHQEVELLRIFRENREKNDEPHEVYHASTTCILGDDDAADDDAADKIQVVGDDATTENACVTVDDDDCTAEEEVVMPCIIDGKTYPGFTKATAVGDSGCSTHLWDTNKYLYNVEKLNGERARGLGTAELTVKGDMSVIFRATDGKSVHGILHSVKVSPSSKFKLFSITSALSKGATLGSDEDNNITLAIKNKVIKFDRRLRTKSGSIQGVEIIPDIKRLHQLREEESEHAHNVRDTRSSKQGIDIQVLHRQLGHPSIAVTRATANAKGWTLTGTIKPCEDCAMGKAQQRQVSKKAVDYEVLQPGEMMSLDISSPGKTQYGSKHFCLMQCVKTDKTFYYFLKAKNHMPKHVIREIKELKKKYGITVKIIRCDGAGENHSLRTLCEEEGLDITFETTAPNTGQHNPVERKIATCFTRLRAMSNDAGLSKEEYKLIWTYPMALLIQMMNEMIKPGQTKSPNELFYGDNVSIPSIFGNGPPEHTFGEVCVSADRTKHKSKFHPRGKLSIWLGPVMSSSPNNHHLFNLQTKRHFQSRDVIFLNQSYSSWKAERALKQAQRNQLLLTSEENMINTQDSDDEADDVAPSSRPAANYVSDDENSAHSGQQDESFETANDELPISDDSDQESAAPPPPTTNARLHRELRRLDASYNPTITAEATAGRNSDNSDTESSADTESGRTDDSDVEMTDAETFALLIDGNYFAEIANVSVESSSAPEEPTNFYDAWNHPNPTHRKHRRKAIQKEFDDYKKRDCFKVVKKSTIPKERRRIKCKWVFKIKRNGLYRARLRACGYSQVPGVDFNQFTSPVIHDTSLRIMLLLLMMNPAYIHRVCDVETAFLYGRIKEQIFMDLPPGYEVVAQVDRDNDCVELLSSIYGTVQAALMYFELWAKTLRKLGFKGGNVDPCLFYRVNELGTVYIAVYVDDNLIIGDEAAVMEVISKLKKNGFTLKTDETLDDYLSCRIVFNKDRTKGWVHQPHIYKKLRTQFGNMVTNTNYVTPGTPNQYISSEQEINNTVPEEQHSQYRTMVGLLNYLVKLTRPDIANAVRNLGKGLAAPGALAWKEGLRVTKFTLDTEDYGLLLNVNRSSRSSGKWILIVYSDSDHAGDPDSRRSISGFALYLNGIPICYRSKAQATVSLSSSEAEWIALSEAVKEIVFVVQLLRDIGIKVDTPVIVKVDNIGAIHMAENVTPSSRTRHIDIRTKFVREYNSGTDPLIKIVLCKSEDNVSDICTKNLSRELHEKHSKALVGKVDWDKWTCK